MQREAQDARRTALDEILVKGQTKKRQERWVVLGGLLMQASAPSAMRKYGSLPRRMKSSNTLGTFVNVCVCVCVVARPEPAT